MNRVAITHPEGQVRATTMPAAAAASASSSWWSFLRPAARVVFFLILLPLTVTHWHVRRQIMIGRATPFLALHKQEYAYLAAATTTNNLQQQQSSSPRRASIPGLYRKIGLAVAQQKQQTEMVITDISNSNNKSIHYYERVFADAAPDAVIVAQRIVNTYGRASRRRRKHQDDDERDLVCVIDDATAGADAACPHPVAVTRQFSFAPPTPRGSRNSNQFWNDVTVAIPATSLWIAVNVALAAVYWNGRVNPSAVAKRYDLMVPAPFEIWRCFSGATAHFEVWHLGFNLMSLASLGRELEHATQFSSVEFFLYNLSLIPVVTAVWLGLQWAADRYLQQSQQQSHPHQHRPTVGFSGVLFAWMVVASLEQVQTCPVVFLPNLCFRTYDFGGWKFSFGPAAQLVILQVILPRVSLAGHLAGIVAGFALHWGFLPIRWVQPAISIPFLYLLYLTGVRKIVSVNREIVVATWKSSGTTTLLLVGHLIVVTASCLLMGLFNSLTMSLALTTVYWFLFVMATQDNSGNSSDAPVVLARGYILAAVLVTVNDAMAMGGWLLLYVFSWPLALLMSARSALLLSTMFVARLAVPTDRGIFEYTLGYTTLHPLRALADHPWLSKIVASAGSSTSSGSLSADDSGDIETAANRTSWSPFAGTGQRLGGAGQILGSSGVSSPPRNQSQDSESASNQEMSRFL